MQRTWLSKLNADHELVGKIWSVKDERFVDRGAVEARLAKAHFVLLGEKHDNPDHHALQGEMIAAVTRSGRKPAVVFEMIDRNLQGTVDEQLSKAPGDVDGFGKAIDWDGSDWPAWAIYRPVFAAAMAAKLPILAANLPRKDTMEIARGTLKLPAEFIAKHRLDTPLPEPLQSALHAELREGHCGYLPEQMLEPVARIQRTRDALMADKLLAADGSDGAILIAGGGHVRRDRAVPWYLSSFLAENGKEAVAIRFAEVDDKLASAADYAKRYDDDIPFDYVWFTPRLDNVDHCKELEKKMKKMKHGPKGGEAAEKAPAPSPGKPSK